MDMKRYRTANGETQEAVATLLGVSRSTYTKYETGDSEPPIATIITLCKHWKISADELLEIPRNSAAAERDAEIKKIADALIQMNEEGRSRLVDYADDLVASGKYIKTDKSAMVFGA